MDIAHRERADRLAAEYVLGTLRGPARRRFETLLPAHPALRDAVAQWRDRLGALALRVAPVEPPERVWRGIERRLFDAGAPAGVGAGRRGGAGVDGGGEAGDAGVGAGGAVAGAGAGGRGDATGTGRGAAPALPWWNRPAPWRARAGAAVLGLVATVALRPAPPAPLADGVPLLVLMAPNPPPGGAAAPAVPTAFVASASADGRALVLRPLAPVALAAGRTLELWAVPAAGAPRSLGLVRADGPTVLAPSSSPRNAAAWAVSVEPAGGSPSGAPTGPIVSLGKLDA